MRMRKLLLTLAIIPALGFAPGVKRAADAESDDTLVVDLQAAISQLRTSVQVTGTATLTTDFGVDYETYNTSETSSIDMIYGSIEEEDGTLTRAVRDLTAENSITYYEGENNTVWTDYLLHDNTVSSEEVDYYGISQTFARTYANPWDYIQPSDIGEDLSLDTEKAHLIVSDYFGYDFSFTAASVTFNTDALIDSVSFTATPKPGIQYAGSTLVDVTQYLEVELSFTYPETSLTHLTPSTDTNGELAAAIEDLADATNYTVYVSSTELSSDIILWVTEGAAYLHSSANAPYLCTSDYFFLEIGNGYWAYRYNGSSWVLATTDFGASSLSITDFTPRISLIDAAVFDRVGSSDTYVLKAEAGAYSAPYLAFTEHVLGLADGEGASGAITLKDGKISSAIALYTLSSSVNVSYSDFGSTELPVWFTSDDLPS